MPDSLWRHQQEELDASWDAPARARLWEPRTGKTLVCVEEMRRLAERRGVRKFLVVLPRLVAPVWLGSLDGFDRHDLTSGSVATRGGVLSERLDGVALVNYDVLHQLRSRLLEWGADYIVADEGHALKTPSSQRSRVMYALGAKASFRRLLSGTPDPQSYRDFYSEYRYLDPSIFGRRAYEFDSRYCLRHPLYPSKILSYINLDELRSKVFSVASRIRRRDCLDIPEEQTIIRRINLSEAEAHEYELAAQSGATVFERLLRAQQFTAMAKVPYAVEEVREWAEAGKKVVIFTRFVEERRAIEAALRHEYPGLVIHTLGGDTSNNDRGRVLGTFGTSSTLANSAAVLVCSVSMGVGISLAACSVAVMVSPTFNYTDYEQSLARIWKPQGKVVYTHLMIPGTVDYFIHQNLTQKHNINAAMLDGLPADEVFRAN